METLPFGFALLLYIALDFSILLRKSTSLARRRRSLEKTDPDARYRNSFVLWFSPLKTTRARSHAAKRLRYSTEYENHALRQRLRLSKLQQSLRHEYRTGTYILYSCIDLYSHDHCQLTGLFTQKGRFEVVAILRIIMASMRQETLGVHFSYTFILQYTLYSIMGAFSIVYSAIRRRTACNPKVYIFLKT